MKFILTFLFLISALKAEFCIQVYSTKNMDTKSTIQEANKPKYNNFKKIRVEQRGKYLVIRIGKYRSKNEAYSDLLKIKQIVPDAYSRSCNFSAQNSLFVKNNNQNIENNYYTPPSTVKESTLDFDFENQHIPEVKSQEIPPLKRTEEQKSYIESEELTYQSTQMQQEDQNLWDQCNKCFSPIYTQEEESVYVTQKVAQQKEEEIVQIKENKIKTTEIEVRIKPRAIQEENDSFWTAEHSENVASPDENNLNINEQFLP